MSVSSGVHKGVDGVGRQVNLAVEADGGITPIRDRYKNVAQTFNAQGQLTSILYTFQGGGTITDTFTYGTNNIVEPENVYRGDLILPAVVIPGLPTTLTTFTISTDGTRLNYAATSPVTALSGTISVAGAAQTLTHISSGVASFSGGVILSSSTGITVTISSATPALAASITGVAVVNNSTATASSTLLLRTLNWDTTSGTTVSGANINISNAGSRSFLMDFTKDFELIFNDTNAAPPQDSGIYIGFAPSNTNEGFGSVKTSSLMGIINYFTSVKAAPLDVSLTPDVASLAQNTVLRLSYTAGVLSLARLVGASYVAIAISPSVANCLVGKPAAYLKVAAFAGVNIYNIQLKTT